MTTAGLGSATRDIPFSDADFRAIARLAQSEFGLNLAESKKPLVYSRLSKRLKARQVQDFQSYLTLLGQRDEGAERLELISALTTNVTSFFREKHHFDTLQDICRSEWPRKCQANGRLRVWSAGCSSGQEAYSIAMTLLETIPSAQQADVKVLATDIDPQIVKKAKAGLYPSDEAAGIPAPLRTKWITTHETQIEVAAEVRALIRFAELNLMSDWPFRGPFDAIFCRNVAIYFNEDTQQRLWTRFSNMLVEGGYLFIGHSERVTGPATRTLSGVGITSYRRTAS
jgi:chemotaxis protein methyltransferase CheR